ncbi:hypothetical protein D6792_00105 [Candidatus Parcubacteria bacterium]|nr:MAG: hypothetical protein D6792_00105 [Candidatus Parcubacteria bacterium]
MIDAMRHISRRLFSRFSIVVVLAVLTVLLGGGFVAYVRDVGGVRSGLPPVVLRFDGQPVSKETFLQYVRLGQLTYFATPEESSSLSRDNLYELVLNDMIANYVLFAAAADRGITVDDAEVQKAIEEMRKRDPDHYAALQHAVGDEAAIRDFIRRDLIIRKFLDAIFESDPIVVTDEEIAALYAAAREQQEATDTSLPELAQVRDIIREEILRQKAMQRVGQLVAQLRPQHTVEVLWQAENSS